MPKFRNIESFIEGNYQIDVPLSYLNMHINEYIGGYNLDLNPDYQRGHVWNTEQQISFVEHVLRGGRNTVIRFNCPNWVSGRGKDMVIVDGKQRMTACLAFLNNDIPAFGYYFLEYEDKMDLFCRLQFIINELPTRKDVLKWYLEINSGNVAHTDEELERVEKLLAAEK